MWKFILFVAFAAVGISCQDEITSFATGGRAAVYGEYPSDCSIDSPFNIHCNGVVINSRHILTTASCVMNGTALAHPAWFRIMCGNNELFVTSPGRYVSGVTHIYPHDQYVPATNLNDLAIIRTAEAIQFPSNTIEQASFNPRPVADNTQCFYSGWGRAANASLVLLPEKRVISAPIVNRVLCNGQTMAHPGRALESMNCAGLHVPTGTVAQATCIGNTGGALYCNDEVVGILAFGMGCGAGNHPGVYIQTRLYINWINTQITRTDTIAPGTTYPRPAN